MSIDAKYENYFVTVSTNFSVYLYFQVINNGTYHSVFIEKKNFFLIKCGRSACSIMAKYRGCSTLWDVILEFIRGVTGPSSWKLLVGSAAIIVLIMHIMMVSMMAACQATNQIED